MASELLVNKITPESGTTLTLGDSGDTISFASGVLPSLESLTITGDLTVDTSTLKVDSTNNRVGIGTASPSYDLQISKDGGGASVRLDVVNTGVAANDDTLLSFVSGSNNNENIIYFGDTDDNNVGIIRYNHASDHMSFTTNTSEAMRIDSSGNVLVGTTALTPGTTTGVRLYNDGRGFFTADGTYAGYFNRLTSDGDIALFRKDGTTVGSINVTGGSIIFGRGDTGLAFNDGLDAVYPITSTGSPRNNAIDIGRSSYKFKDLYLGGNIYLGGTGSANALDDYEEGTWTPSVSSGTITVVGASYTKVGRLVTVNFTISTFSDTTSTSSIGISGLPFTSASGNGFDSSGSVMFRYVDTLGDGLSTFLNDNTTSMQIYMNHTDGNWTSVKYNSLNNASMRFIITHTYQAA